MSALSLFLLQVGIYSAFPCTFAAIRRPVRMVLLTMYVAIVLLIGGLLGSVYGVVLPGGVAVSAGSVAYGALMMTTVLLVIVGRDVRVVRHVILIVIAVNLFKLVAFWLTASALDSGNVRNPFATSPELFRVSVLTIIVGGGLIIGELLLLLAIFETTKTRIRSTRLLTAVYVLAFMFVICLDGMLFPVLAQPFSPELLASVTGGMRGKLVLAVAFALPLVAFLIGYRRALNEFRITPLHLRLMFGSSDELVEEIERQHTELTTVEANYRNLVASTGDAVVGATLAGEITTWNKSAEALYGISSADAVGRDLVLMLPLDRAVEMPRILRVVRNGGMVRDLEVDLPGQQGRAVSITVSPVVDADGVMTGLSAIARDVSDRRSLERSLERQALHDGLTGLPNRTLLADRLDHALRTGERRGTRTAVLFADLDQFKHINDGAGHATGDAVLRAVGDRFASVLRATDTVARFGGDEFVILCEDTNPERAAHVATRLLAALEPPLAVGDDHLLVTASIGIAVSPPHDGGMLIGQADVAMYEAKSKGRNRFAVFDESMAKRARERVALAGNLRDAIHHDQLTLLYQPVIDLRTGVTVSAEALSRWHHPMHGDVSPGTFVVLAEECGLAGALDRLVMQRACIDAATALAAAALPEDGHIAVNVSAGNISDGSITTMVEEAVAAAGPSFRHENLTVEVTETAMMADLSQEIGVLEALRMLGVSISIDDFGTGFSSLTYLRRFPVTVVKIDRSFISQIDESAQDRAIVGSVIQLAHAIDMRTVAEGVETPSQLQVLAELGCDFGQGFYFSPPVPLDDLITFATSSRGAGAGTGW